MLGGTAVTAVTVDPGGDLASLVAAEAAGRVDRFHGEQEWTAPESRIESGAALLEVGGDSEVLRLPPPLGLSGRYRACHASRPDEPAASPAAGGTPGAGDWLAAVALLRVLTCWPAR